MTVLVSKWVGKKCTNVYRGKEGAVKTKSKKVQVLHRFCIGIAAY